MSDRLHQAVPTGAEPVPRAAPSPVESPAAVGSPVAGLRDAAAVLLVQRAAGNAAVARLMPAHGHGLGSRVALWGGGPPRTGVARYEAGEHAQFGKDEIAMVNGVPISRGNIIAMGDFFRTPEDMQKADPDVLRKLDAAITQDRRARLGQTDPATGQVPKIPSNADIQSITKPLGAGNTYMDLNKENEAHFAPPAGGPSPGGKDNRSMWEKLHRQALDEARATKPEAPQTGSGTSSAGGVPSPSPGGGATPAPTPGSAGGTPAPAPAAGGGTPSGAGARPPGVPEKAVTTNMFAAHFLTDAFSAGHLINKKEVMDQAKATWAKMATSGVLLKENSFTKEVSDRVLADSKVKAKMADKQIINVRAIGAFAAEVIGGGSALATARLMLIPNLYVDVTPPLLSEILHVTSRVKPDTFFNIFARMVHDRLNREGVEVQNDEGTTWRLSGDETLKSTGGSGPDGGMTLEIGRRAVAESEKNLEEAAAAPDRVTPPYDALLARVWRLVPRPTSAGHKFIDDVRQELTDAANPKAVDEAVRLSVAEIDTAIEEMEALYILRPKPGAAAAGAGRSAGTATPAPAVPAGVP